MCLVRWKTPWDYGTRQQEAGPPAEGRDATPLRPWLVPKIDGSANALLQNCAILRKLTKGGLLTSFRAGAIYGDLIGASCKCIGNSYVRQHGGTLLCTYGMWKLWGACKGWWGPKQAPRVCLYGGAHPL